MGIKFANSAFATLAAGINSSVTSITLTTGQGARFPSLAGGDYFFATLIDTSNNLEIVKCTARATDVLTVVRAQESTTARAFATGDRIELRVTAQGLVDASGGLSSGVVDIPGTSASGAIVRLYEDTDNGTHYVGLKAAAAIASSLDFVLPSADGTNGQFLKTDGSRNLSFGTVVAPAEYQQSVDYTTTDRSLAGDSGWVDHLSITFTPTVSCTVLCFANYAHGREDGPVNVAARFILDGGTTTQEVQIIKQGIGSSYGFGAHSSFGFFTSVSAAAHTVKLQVRNSASGSTGVMNYFGQPGGTNHGDFFSLLYK